MEEARGIAARIWCEPQHANKVMDPDFAESIAKQIFAGLEAERKKVAELEAEILRWRDNWTNAVSDTQDEIGKRVTVEAELEAERTRSLALETEVKTAIQEMGGPKMEYAPSVALQEYRAMELKVSRRLLKALRAYQTQQRGPVTGLGGESGA
jgi:hypothetical protein